MSAVQWAVSKGYRLDLIKGGREEVELMRFRHRIFREELRWVPESVDGLDRDDYDSFSDNYAVSTRNIVVGSMRLTPGRCPFMLEREFESLVPAGLVVRKGAGSAEVTRLAVGVGRDGKRPERAARLLYFGLYQWACAYQVQLMYFVVEPAFFRYLLHLGFPAFPLGRARPLEGGVMSQAGYLDWDQANPGFIHWLRSVFAARAAVPAQSRASDYSR